VKGSLWSWILAVSFVLAGVIQLRAWGDAPIRRWLGTPRSRQLALGVGGVMGLLALGILLQWVSPGLYDRWSSPEGVWEALTVLFWLASALLLVASARHASPGTRRHFHLMAGVFVLFFLEEIDYFGIFGGLIGRINGVYVGAPHDLVNLALHGHLPPAGYAAIAGVVVLLLGLLLRSGHIQPRRILATLRSPAGPWVLVGAVALGVAQVEDVGLIQLGADPGMEELLEAVAGWAGVTFALEVAAREGRA
jgi:hypothetical protein